MTSTSYNIVEVLEKLGSNKSVNDTIATLTFINSDTGRMNLFKTMNSTQHLELCKLLVDLIASSDDSNKNKDLSKVDEKAEQAIRKFLKKEIDFFEIVLKIDRSKRLKIFQFLKTLDDDVFLRILEDSFVIKYLDDCMQAINPETMAWLSPSVCIDNIQLLLEAEEKSLKNMEDQLIINSLNFLERIYGIAINSPSFKIQKFHLLIFEKVIPLTYMGHKKQRTPALQLMNRALRSDFEDFIREKHENILASYKTSLQNHYCTRMLSLVNAKQSDWCYLWCFSLEIVGTDLYHGADLINNLLLVEEKAFKSTDMTIRHQAFIAWKSLINIFASNPTHFIVPRRIKLLCIPLISKNSKTEIIAVTKLQTWWHLIAKLYPYIETFENNVIFQFLNFCFGPLGETPLLSTKCDVASPGKRFLRARIYAVDALLQLLVANEKDRREVSLVLDQKIQRAVTNSLFKKNYKCFIHSVGEAVLIISDLNGQSEEKRIKLNNILWLNLMNYIQQASSDLKIKMNKELILVIGEIINHLEDCTLISNLLFNVILPELIKVTGSVVHRDTTMVDLLKKILSMKFLTKAEKKNWNDIKILVCHGIKPDSVKTYSPHVLSLLKIVISQMQSAKDVKINDIFIAELWCALSESITKYIADNQQINEGTAVSHNFETILSLIIFPLKTLCWSNSEQMSKMVKIWRDLYKEFNVQADLITTVKFNEILNNVSEAMENYLLLDTKCYSFIVHCFGVMMNTIHYGELLKQDRAPSIVILLRDVTTMALSNMNSILEIECSLKAMSSLLITVYGLNQEKALDYLRIVSSTTENLLKVEAVENIQKEIANTWETVVLILRGLSKLLTYDFLFLYREAIICGLCHINTEIASETLSFLEIENDLDEKSKALLKSIENDAKKIITTNKTIREPKNEIFNKTSKSVKLVGSFFGRPLSSPKTVSSKKEKIKKSAPILPEPESQEYVVINTDIKVNVNLLTEHQKECFKQQRDDIPAMYNELSQSGSCNTQQLEEWFKDKGANSNLQTKDIVSVDIDANKENKNDSAADSTTDRIPKLNQLSKTPQSDADKTSDIQTVDKKLSADELSPLGIDNDTDKYDENNQGSENVAKKLNFESHEEFPDENDQSNDTKHNLRGSKRRGRSINTINSRSNRNKPEENNECQITEYPLIQLTRIRTRSSKFTDKVSPESECVGKGLKRKAGDVESDDDSATKRRRHTVIPPSNDINESQSNLIKIGNQFENVNDIETDPNLPERTKKEISRLKIDMVFDSKMTSKLRFKPSDDFIYETIAKRHSLDNKSTRQKSIKLERDGPSSEQSHELLKRRRKRDSKTAQEIKCEFTELQKSETDTVILKNNEDYKELTDSGESDKSLSSRDEEDEKLDNDLKESIENPSLPINTSTEKHQATQDDEVIESSQESCLIKSLSTKNDKKLIITNDKNDISQLPSARKDLQHSSLVKTTKSSPSENIKPHNSKELAGASVMNSLEIKKQPYNESKLSSTVFTYSSPKSKRISKFKIYTSHGRAAHMLDLVTKHAIGEKNKPGKNTSEGPEEKGAQDINKEVNFVKEVDVPVAKKDYLGLYKESDRVSSPIGHRQEKIFNNMRSGDNSSPPPKLFSNLKNDGEKISPKMEKSVKDQVKVNDHDYTEVKDVDQSVSFEREELPILEWSSANPPSLTASPSVSILKRQRQALIESDIETTPQKKKRVSFADPPVSKQMGYEIITEMSPSKSKTGASYSFPGRKGTPYRPRHLRLRTIEIPADKQNLLVNGNKAQNQEDIQNDSFMSIISVNLDDYIKDIEETIVNPMELDFNLSNRQPAEINEFSSTKDQNEQNTTAEDKKDIALVEESATQQDVFSEDDNINNVEKMNLNESCINDKNDSTIARIINESIDDEKSEALEDTVDIQNVSNITANSDEFDIKPVSTNSQIAANNSIAECDTLPLIDSMLSSQGSIQNSQELSQSEFVNTKEYIYPELLGCETPIDAIIDRLVNPLWRKNLSKCFNSKHINTIGDLARLTEQEVTQIPINKSSKVNYVKKILQEFSKSFNPSKTKINVVENNSKIIHETKQSESFNDSVGISPLKPSVEPSDNLNITEVLTNLTQQTPEDKVCGSYGSMILDTSISPPKKTSTVLINQIQESPVRKVSIAVSTDSSVFTKTQAVGTQATLEELLDELDENLVLQNVIKRSSLQSLLNEYKLKTKGTDEELKKDILKILGISMSPETGLKHACRNYGLIKVLNRLSIIYDNDKQFFSKVLNTYRTKITTEDCFNAFKLDEIKEEFCKKCSSAELCDMILKVLTKEEEEAKDTIITNTSCLNAMIKRMPIKSVINNTIDNNELIPSSAVLDVALKNNSLDTILQGLEIKSPNVRQKVIEKYLTSENIVSYVKEQKILKNNLLDIYEAISDQLTSNELIDLNAKVLKKKFQLRRTDDTNE